MSKNHNDYNDLCNKDLADGLVEIVQLQAELTECLRSFVAIGDKAGCARFFPDLQNRTAVMDSRCRVLQLKLSAAMSAARLANQAWRER